MMKNSNQEISEDELTKFIEQVDENRNGLL